MAKCFQMDSCSFFGEVMTTMPTVAEMMKKQYCFADYDSCARLTVFKALGKGHAPLDLAPNDIQRAHRIIRDATGNKPPTP